MTEPFFGLPDDAFARGSVPMTKAEVRWVIAASLRLFPQARLLDIGAGTGSVSIECSRLCPLGSVVALEKNPEAIRLIRTNAENMHATNLTIIEGHAPASLAPLGRFNRIFVGGTGGELADIFATLPHHLQPNGRIVMSAICLETFAEAYALLQQPPWQNLSVTQLSVARAQPLGRTHHSLVPLNPVWILSADWEGES